MKLKYFSHSAFQVTTDSGIKILIDPFLDNNPTSPVKSDDVNADYIILSHAHSDHLGDAIKIAKRCKLTFICVNELGNYLMSKGFETHNMHIGGGYDFDFGRVKFTIAHHGSQTPEGTYAGEPAGIILQADGKTIYHTGDTGLFLDMKLIGEMNGPIDYMLLAIGGNFTMNITDAVKAAELVRPKVAIPIHYNTFPVIKVDPLEFKKKAEAAGIKSSVLAYGEEIKL
jgi:L-ascorbate metabolism protein UlaG (beta-lactamase superfamily)